MCLLSDELTATAAIYPWRHTALRLMGGGLQGAGTQETLSRLPRLSQLVPRTRPARQIQACQSTATIWPCCLAVATPGQNGAGAAVGTLFWLVPMLLLIAWSPKGSCWSGEVGCVQCDGKMYAVSFAQTQNFGRHLTRKEAKQRESERVEGLMAKT